MSIEERKLRDEDALFDAWHSLEWSDAICEIVARYKQLDDIIDALIDLATCEDDEDWAERNRNIFIEAVGQAQGEKDLMKHYTRYLWLVSKQWFADDERIYADIVKELL